MYSPTYTRNQKGKFNIERNLASIFAGTDAYLLEDEVNEMQWIQNEARASLIRKLIQSGHHTTGDIEAALTNLLNGFIIGKQIAFVNGYEITVANNKLRTDGKNSIVLADPPTSGTRQDLVFLEVWFASLSSTDYLYHFGGVENATLTNDTEDPRIGNETSRRVQLRWRIRTVSGVNTASYPDGISDINNVFAWGGNTTNTTLNFVKSNDDPTLYIAGSGFSSDITTLNTIDGFVYAIPMFIVNRLNSGTYDVNTNPNGAPIYADSATPTATPTATPIPSDRPDGRYSNIIYADQIIDKRYISQTTILKYFTDNGSVLTLNKNLTLSGNLTVNGTTVTMNQEEMNISDTFVRLNSGFTGNTPTQDAGIEIERGGQSNTQLKWSESNKIWQATTDGTNFYNILLSNQLAVSNGIPTLDSNSLVPFSQLPPYSKSVTLIVSSDANHSDYRDIQSAINALPSSGGTIYVREGIYQQALTMKSNVVIIGQGYSTIIQLPNGANVDNVITCNSVTNARISNLKIDANKLNQTSGLNNGVGLYTCNYFTLDNVSIENCNGSAVYLDTTTSSNVKSNIIKNSASGITDFGDPAGATNNGNEFSSNKVESCTTGIELDAHSTYDIATNNVTRSCTTSIVNSGTNNVVANNVII